VAARLLVLLFAVVAVGFLAVEERGTRAADSIFRAALDPHGTPGAAELTRAAELARTARNVSPDTQPIVDLGVLEGRAGRYRAAGAHFAEVTRREPENVRAWVLLSLVANRYDSGLAARARARARSLAPPIR
jgi:hypothetical protein